MSNSVRPYRWQHTMFCHLWDSPGKNTGVVCHFLLQCMKVKRESEVAQSCPTPSDPMDCNLPGSSVRGIFQARVLEWGAIAFSKMYQYVDIKYVQLFYINHISVKWVKKDPKKEVYFMHLVCFFPFLKCLLIVFICLCWVFVATQAICCGVWGYSCSTASGILLP